MPAESLDPFDTDRPRGILNTTRERPYLLDESDIEPKTRAERSVRQSIRKHIRHSLLDFQILYQKLAERDRTQIIPETESHQRTNPNLPPIRGGVVAMLAFAFQLDEHEKTFEETIEEGIRWAVQESGWQAEVDVTINLERTERLDDVLSRAREEGTASNDDLIALLMTGRVDMDEWRDLRYGSLDVDE